MSLWPPKADATSLAICKLQLCTAELFGLVKRKSGNCTSLRLANVCASAVQKDGKQQPGAKGLAMSPPQWRKLADAIPQLTSAAEAEDVYKGQVQVDLREHYEKDGDLTPGGCLTLLEYSVHLVAMYVLV